MKGPDSGTCVRKTFCFYGKERSQPNSTAVTTGTRSVQGLRKQIFNNRPPAGNIVGALYHKL
jgi:hypothetical protein